MTELATRIRELEEQLTKLDGSKFYDEEKFEFLDPAARAVVAAFQAEERAEEAKVKQGLNCIQCGAFVSWAPSDYGARNADVDWTCNDQDLPTITIGSSIRASSTRTEVLRNGVCRACLDKGANR